LLQRGELRLRRGKYSDAQMDLNVVLHENPNLPEAHFLQSQIYEKSGATLTERQQLNETLRLNPLFLPARLALAHLLTSANAFKNAMELLDETPPEQKASLAILVERNWVYAAMGDWKRCQQGITQGLAIQRTSDLLIQEALSKFEHKDFAGAEASAREALHQAPGDVRALEALGLSYLGREEVVAAKAKLQEYVSQQPQSAAVQLFWGKWLLAVGDTNAARAALSAARTANGDTTEVDLNLARADLGDRNWNSARQTLQAILAHNGENVTARYWLAQVEEIQGNHHASEEQYRKVIAADPANVKALNNLAYLLAETAAGASDALSFAQRAKALAPEDPAVADTLGWVFYRNGLYRLAIRELKQVNMVQSTARRASHLSMAYFKAGDENRAQEALARARKMDPSDPEVMQAERLIAGKAMTKAELKESGQFPKSFPRVLEFQNHRM
jgi:Tfp pilus assembly protein PilF